MVSFVAEGTFEYSGESDWFKVYLKAGHTYKYTAGNNFQGVVQIHLPDGSALPLQFGNVGRFVAPVDGVYYIDAKAAGATTASFYQITMTEVSDPVPGAITTTATLAVGETKSFTSGDEGAALDWFAVDLVAGQSYLLTGGGSFDRLTFADASGNILVTNNTNAHFTAAASGRYYVGYSTYSGSDHQVRLTQVADDHSDIVGAPTTALTLGTAANGIWEAAADTDWYAVTLQAGTSYTLVASTTTGGPNQHMTVRVADASGKIYESGAESPVTSATVFTPTTTGTYYIGAQSLSTNDANIGYSVTASVLANDLAASNATTAVVSVGSQISGSWEAVRDKDWIAVQLTAGQSYAFTLATTASDSPTLSIVDSQGRTLAASEDSGDGAAVHLTAAASGTYYINAGAGQDPTPLGSYAVAVSAVADDFANNASTAGVLTVGVQAAGNHEAAGDHDWFAVNLTAGQSYLIDAPRAVVRDAAGNDLSGRAILIDIDSTFTPTVSGTYFIDVFGGSGAYDVRVTTFDDDFGEAPDTFGVAYQQLSGTANGDQIGLGYDWSARINGLDGDDTITGSSYADQIEGGAGNDHLAGGGGDDVINDIDGGNDAIDGGAGNDDINAGGGDDIVIGGDGDDVIIDDEGGNDTLYGGEGNDTIIDLVGTNSMIGGAGDDFYYIRNLTTFAFEDAGAGAGDDTMQVLVSSYLFANIENLILSSSASASNTSSYGVGNELANKITGNFRDNLLIGGAGDDQVGGGTGNDNLYGEDGADALNGEAGIDYLVGGAGSDTLDGGLEADALYGEDGDDTLTGGTSFDTDILVGGAGNDILHGDSGMADYDLIDGGAGDDTYYVDTGDDLTFEAADGGADIVYANVGGANNGVYLYANVENLVLLNTTTFGVGNELANTMTGNASGNWLLGGAGADVLNGKAGNDVLFGEGGADKFVFEAGTGGDVIGDFQAGTDKIDISAYFSNWQDVVNSMHENGGTTAIDLGGANLIVLNGVASATLSQSDFILAAGAPAAPRALAATVPDNAPDVVLDAPHHMLRIGDALPHDLFL